MTKISTDQALERWDTLPLVLREALYSEPNSDFLWKTCEYEHIPDEKIYDASRISGYVLMGFLHPEDVAVELKNTIGIDQKTASSIQSALNQRIFAPLRKEIDAVYAPLSKFETGPKIMQEVRPPMPAGPTIISESFSATAAGAPKISAAGMPPTPSGVPRPKPQQVFSQTAAGMSLGAAPLASNKNIAASAAPQPAKPGTDKGWSRQTTQDPVVKLGVITPSMPTPMPAAAGNAGLNANAGAVTPSSANRASMPSNASAPSSQANHMSEFERLDMMKKSATPPPMMLHEVSSGMPTEKTPDFRIAAGMQNQINKTTTPPPMPVRSAVIEFGGSATAQAPANIPAKPSMPASTGPRQVTEVGFVPPTPRPAPPPMPPKAPTAQSQTQPTPANKVIVKDFLGPEK